MNGGDKALLRIARRVALLSALAIGAVLGVLFVYIAYVYRLWVHAMREDGGPGGGAPGG